MSEMDALRAELSGMGVPWRDLSAPGRQRTLYMGTHGTVAVIVGENTCGGDRGLLEAWNPGEPHEGWLRAEEVPELFPPTMGKRCTRA